MTSPLVQNQAIQRNGIEYGVAVCKLMWSDLTDADTEQTITLAALVAAHPIGASKVPANAIVGRTSIRRITDFSGGTVAALTFNLGDAALPSELAGTVDIFPTTASKGKIQIAAAQHFLLALLPRAVQKCLVHEGEA